MITAAQAVAEWAALLAGQPPATPTPAPAPTPPPGVPPGGQPPEQPGTPNFAGPIPGRGFAPSTWNDATKAAVAAWEAAHPGWKLDGSAVGYTAVAPPPTAQPPVNEPGIPSGAPPDTNSPEYASIQQRLTAGKITAEQAATEWEAIQSGQWGITMPTGSSESFSDRPVIPQAPYGSGGPDTMYAMQAPSYRYSPAGVQAPTESWNYSPTLDGSMQVYPPGVTSRYDTPDISTQQPISPDTAKNLYQFGGATAETATTAAPTAPTPDQGTAYATNPYAAGKAIQSGSMLLPSQINAESYKNTPGYLKELGWAGYEDAGWDRGLAQEMFERSLPKYSGPKTGSFAF